MIDTVNKLLAASGALGVLCIILLIAIVVLWRSREADRKEFERLREADRKEFERLREIDKKAHEEEVDGLVERLIVSKETTIQNVTELQKRTTEVLAVIANKKGRA